MAIEVIVLLILLLYFFIFLSRDEIFKRKIKRKSLEHEKSWIDYKRVLPKYIP
jgi:hypothetical protein